MRRGEFVTERARVPPEKVVAVLEAAPFPLCEQVAEGRVAKSDGLGEPRQKASAEDSRRLEATKYLFF